MASWATADCTTAQHAWHAYGPRTPAGWNGCQLSGAKPSVGFWIKIDVRQVPLSPHAPHGIRYSLTLHDKYGTRVLGDDHAHAVQPPKQFKFAGRRLPYDHRHRTASDNGVPYVFESAHRLLQDFFAEADRVIKEARQ